MQRADRKYTDMMEFLFICTCHKKKQDDKVKYVDIYTITVPLGPLTLAFIYWIHGSVLRQRNEMLTEAFYTMAAHISNGKCATLYCIEIMLHKLGKTCNHINLTILHSMELTDADTLFTESKTCFLSLLWQALELHLFCIALWRPDGIGCYVRYQYLAAHQGLTSNLYHKHTESR